MFSCCILRSQWTWMDPKPKVNIDTAAPAIDSIVSKIVCYNASWDQVEMQLNSPAARAVRSARAQRRIHQTVVAGSHWIAWGCVVSEKWGLTRRTTVGRLGLSSSQVRRAREMRRRGETGCYCLPVMRSGEGVFIRRDKYSTREVSSRENRERNK